jgi:HAD superfamily hydrolase (TIGR01490 family)
MTETANKYFAFFDLDMTMLDVNSGTFLVKQAYKNRLMDTGELLNAIIQGFRYRFSLRDTHIIITEMGKWLKGLPKETLDKLGEEVANNLATNNIRPEIIKEIEFHRKMGGSIILLTSSINSLCEPLGKKIGSDGIICTVMEVKNGILTGMPAGKFCFDDEKRVRLIEWCIKNSSDPAKAWYYADSIADLPALKVVGHPVCVSPDKNLRKAAIMRGWRILDTVR